MNRQLTVVIPAFNAELTIGSMLSSLPADNPLLEVIVVDDGSEDRTSVLASSFAQVEVVRISNSGSAAARNRGLDHANGKFVAFLDADDTVTPEFLRACQLAVRGDSLDCWISSYEHDVGNAAAPTRVTPPRVDVTSPRRTAVNFMSQMSFQRYFFRREFLERYGIRFLPESRHVNLHPFSLDDLFFLIQVWASRPRARTLPFVTYHYNAWHNVGDSNHRSQMMSRLPVGFELLRLWSQDYDVDRELVFGTAVSVLAQNARHIAPSNSASFYAGSIQVLLAFVRDLGLRGPLALRPRRFWDAS